MYHPSAPNRERGVLWWACVCVCACACVNIESAGSRSLPQEQRVPRRRVVRLAGVSRRHFRYTSIRCAVVSQAFSVFVQLVAQVYLQQTDVTEFEPMTKNLRKSAKFRIRHKAGLSYASETQQLSYVRWLTPHSLWSCCGAVDSQWRADLQHTLATQRLRERCSRKRQISDLRFF